MCVNRRRESNIGGDVQNVGFSVSNLSHVSAKDMQKHIQNKNVLAIKSEVESKKELKETIWRYSCIKKKQLRSFPQAAHEFGVHVMNGKFFLK